MRYGYHDLEKGPLPLRLDGASDLEPSYGRKFPDAPAVDQHHFDIEHLVMYRWDGEQWRVRRVIFIGEILPG